MQLVPLMNLDMVERYYIYQFMKPPQIVGLHRCHLRGVYIEQEFGDIPGNVCSMGAFKVLKTWQQQ